MGVRNEFKLQGLDETNLCAVAREFGHSCRMYMIGVKGSKYGAY